MKSPLSGKPQLNRKINASLVFDLIQREGPVSRADLAKRTGIRPTSISAIVQHLINEGLVRETGRGPSTGGRHPILLDIDAGGLQAAGFEIAAQSINGVIVDLSGHSVAQKTISIPDTQVETILIGCGQLLDDLCSSQPDVRDQLSGVGVAVPGIITREKGEVVLSRPLGWRNVRFQDLLSRRLQTGVHLLNNAMAGAMAEYYSRKGLGVRSLLYVLVYLQRGREPNITSVGCGIVLDGRAYLGEGEIAGEVRVDVEHPLATARKSMGEAAAPDLNTLIAESCKAPDAYARVWTTLARKLAQLVSYGVDFLSPGRVIVGTDTPELGQLIGPEVERMVHAQTVAGLVTDLQVSREKKEPRVEFAHIETDTLARGAILPRLQEISLAPLLRDGVLS